MKHFDFLSSWDKFPYLRLGYDRAQNIDINNKTENFTVMAVFCILWFWSWSENPVGKHRLILLQQGWRLSCDLEGIQSWNNDYKGNNIRLSKVYVFIASAIPRNIHIQDILEWNIIDIWERIILQTHVRTRFLISVMYHFYLPIF